MRSSCCQAAAAGPASEYLHLFSIQPQAFGAQSGKATSLPGGAAPAHAGARFALFEATLLAEDGRRVRTQMLLVTMKRMMIGLGVVALGLCAVTALAGLPPHVQERILVKPKAGVTETKFKNVLAAQGAKEMARV